MTSTKNRIFDPSPLSICVHMSQTPPRLWTSTCSRHEIHIALLKRLVQWPSGSNAEIRLYYDCNFFKTVLLIIFITNLYRRKISIFIPSKDEILVKRTPTSLHEKKTERQSMDSNFNFLRGRPHRAWPPPLVHMRPPEPDPLPLRVDVLNGWPPYGPGDAVERVNRSSMVALQTLLSRVTCFAFNILRFMISGVKVADETFPSSYLSYFYLNLLRSDSLIWGSTYFTSSILAYRDKQLSLLNVMRLYTWCIRDAWPLSTANDDV